jgi:hypothetical protein
VHHGRKLLVQAPSRADPQEDDSEEDATQVRGGVGERPKDDDQHLLNGGAARLAEGVADDVDGGLALGLEAGGK